ncbi:Hypothetical predicted protein [Octopus vulgaris]|uniref:Uncharacterized protein n=1 Tax=Octopus vulgaris TaxID=6645 RepID=A0AA36AZW8_OCTVU|nr:Hypothetical predicted protein [Octopus vulgaris]
MGLRGNKEDTRETEDYEDYERLLLIHHPQRYHLWYDVEKYGFTRCKNCHSHMPYVKMTLLRRCQQLGAKSDGHKLKCLETAQRKLHL